jgi:hypothetical protein
MRLFFFATSVLVVNAFFTPHSHLKYYREKLEAEAKAESEA